MAAGFASTAIKKIALIDPASTHDTFLPKPILTALPGTLRSSGKLDLIAAMEQDIHESGQLSL